MDSIRRRSSTLPWCALSAAISLDVGGLFLLVAADGLRSPAFAVLALAAFGVEVVLFAVALGGIEASIAFAVYGLGTAAVAVISIVLLDEPSNPVKLVALATIVVGVVTLSGANAKPCPASVNRHQRAAEPFTGPVACAAAELSLDGGVTP